MPFSSLLCSCPHAPVPVSQFTWGGDWAIALPAQIKHNLTWFFFDGVFASASDNIVITYLVFIS